MKNTSIAFALAAALLCHLPLASAQVSATANGGAGGTGGTANGGMATGGTAAGGAATNNNTTTSGTSSATGGTNTSTAAGGTANVGSATSNYQGADVNVNYTTPAGAAGINGLAAGVDPNTGHIVTDNNVNYSGTTKIKNTPDVSIGGPASGSCNGLSGGLGVGIPGLAVAGNISTVDKGCEARETARIAAMLGRMDVANAILENMDVVVSALKARSERDAQAAAAVAAQNLAANTRASAARGQAAAAQPPAPPAITREQEAEAMRAQQQAGIEALSRQATMQKVNDTLTFTGKLTQGEEKTPQQLMAEQLAAKPVEQPAASPAPPTAPVARAAPVPSDARTEPAKASPDAASNVGQGAPASSPLPDKPSATHAQTERTKPVTLTRRQPDERDPKVERKSKAADQTDAIRFALGLDDDVKTAAAR